MKTTTTFLYAAVSAILAVTMAGCGHKNEKSPAAAEHEQWLASLPDSVEKAKSDLQAAESRLTMLHDSVGRMLARFEHADNPRQVEGYTIIRGWSRSYPLTSTGIIARITEDERLEIIAALKGGVFSRIKAVASSGEVAESDDVPHDQALNYRQSGLNTVAFSGAGADSIAALAASASGPVTIEFLNPGHTGSIRLDGADLENLRQTWLLYQTQRQAEQLERSLPLLSKKIDILRRRIDRADSETETES